MGIDMPTRGDDWLGGRPGPRPAPSWIDSIAAVAPQAPRVSTMAVGRLWGASRVAPWAVTRP